MRAQRYTRADEDRKSVTLVQSQEAPSAVLEGTHARGEQQRTTPATARDVYTHNAKSRDVKARAEKVRTAPIHRRMRRA